MCSVRPHILSQRCELLGFNVRGGGCWNHGLLGFDTFWFGVGSIVGNVPDKLVFSILQYKNIISALIMQKRVFSEMLVSTYQITRRHKAVITISIFFTH
jgi:hypothetical protein